MVIDAILTTALDSGDNLYIPLRDTSVSAIEMLAHLKERQTRMFLRNFYFCLSHVGFTG